MTKMLHDVLSNGAQYWRRMVASQGLMVHDLSLARFKRLVRVLRHHSQFTHIGTSIAPTPRRDREEASRPVVEAFDQAFAKMRLWKMLPTLEAIAESTGAGRPSTVSTSRKERQREIQSKDKHDEDDEQDQHGNDTAKSEPREYQVESSTVNRISRVGYQVAVAGPDMPKDESADASTLLIDQSKKSADGNASRFRTEVPTRVNGKLVSLIVSTSTTPSRSKACIKQGHFEQVLEGPLTAFRAGASFCKASTEEPAGLIALRDATHDPFDLRVDALEHIPSSMAGKLLRRQVHILLQVFDRDNKGCGRKEDRPLGRRMWICV